MHVRGSQGVFELCGTLTGADGMSGGHWVGPFSHNKAEEKKREERDESLIIVVLLLCCVMFSLLLRDGRWKLTYLHV